MTTVAELGVNVVAKTDSIRASMGDASSAMKNGFLAPIGALQSLSHEMHGLLGGVREFRPLLEAGFGVEIGRRFFEQAHEGIAHFIEGTMEGIKANETFGQSIKDGVSKIFGMKTAFEEAAEAQKKIVENAQAAEKVYERIREEQDAARGKSQSDYYGGKQESSNVDALRDSAMKAAKDAADKQSEIDAITVKSVQAAWMSQAGFGGSPEPLSQSQAEEEAKRQRDELHAKYDAVIQQAGELMANLKFQEQAYHDNALVQGGLKQFGDDIEKMRQKVAPWMDDLSEGFHQWNAAAKAAAEADRKHAEQVKHNLEIDRQSAEKIERVQEELWKKQQESARALSSIGGAAERGGAAAYSDIVRNEQIGTDNPLIAIEQEAKNVLVDMKGIAQATLQAIVGGAKPAVSSVASIL